MSLLPFIQLFQALYSKSKMIGKASETHCFCNNGVKGETLRGSAEKSQPVISFIFSRTPHWILPFSCRMMPDALFPNCCWAFYTKTAAKPPITHGLTDETGVMLTPTLSTQFMMPSTYVGRNFLQIVPLKPINKLNYMDWSGWQAPPETDNP